MIDKIIETILESKKYKYVSRDLITRLVTTMSQRYKKNKDIINAVKRELHISYESFLIDNNLVNARKIITDSNDINEVINNVIIKHKSTKERLSSVNVIYDYIKKNTTDYKSIIDIGCGLNPITLPLWNNDFETYMAYDVSSDIIDTINIFFEKFYNSKNYNAAVRDITNIHEECDVLLSFKILPILDSFKKGSSQELLNNISFKRAIISFPLKSLSGKSKNMKTYYETNFESQIKDLYKIIDKAEFDNELFYIIEKN